MCWSITLCFNIWEIKSMESMHLMVSAGNDVDNWSVGGSGAHEGEVDKMWVTLKIASLIPISVAKRAASSMALASASSGPNNNGNFLLKATTTKLIWSRITTLMPTIPVCEKTAASVFILYHGMLVGPSSCPWRPWVEVVDDEQARILLAWNGLERGSPGVVSVDCPV